MNTSHVQRLRLAPITLALALSFAAGAAEPDKLIADSKKMTPSPPWAAGDERGMANQLGAGTYARCSWHMTRPQARTYELSQVRSNTAPKSPFAGADTLNFGPTTGIPTTRHGYNTESYVEKADPAQQGTQFDALGHFGVLKSPWDGKAPYPFEDLTYYGGFTQKDVKPTESSPLQKLGMEKVPPIITSAVVLDAKAFVGKGTALKAGDVVTTAHIEGMLRAQGLAKRGILPGDVVYIRTGWSDRWADPDTEKVYYAMAPGISSDAAKYLGEKRIVAIGLDTPFVDSVPEGFLQGKAGPAAGAIENLPFSTHHVLLTQYGVHLIENANLAAIANDKTWTSCTMILPLRLQGSAGSGVRPISIGVPNQK